MKYNAIVGKYTLESLTNGMYETPLDLFREYIQNAADSLDLTENGIDKSEESSIQITIDRHNSSITISDNGTGVKKAYAASTLIDIGNSQKRREQSRGFRGIGRLAGLGYCDELLFLTSAFDESVMTEIAFNAKLLRQLLLDDKNVGVSVSDVLNQIVTVRTLSEDLEKHYFTVVLKGISKDDGLLDHDSVKKYLVERAPIPFSTDFIWKDLINSKFNAFGKTIQTYHIFLDGEELFKPYGNNFISDRVRKAIDRIQDVNVVPFDKDGKIQAIFWYAETNYYGTILDDSIKGIRIRQGNIQIGNKSTFNQFFKEERFNGWMIGELHVFDNDLIANARRDGFEHNIAFQSLGSLLTHWALNQTKEIRHLSYKRSQIEKTSKLFEDDTFDDDNGLLDESLSFFGNLNESDFLEVQETDEVAVTDYLAKLTAMLNDRQTKYNALNVNERITLEQKRVLERVFDILVNNYSNKKANEMIILISNEF